MRRYYYDNWLAKVLLKFSTCHTIAVTWFVLSKLSEEQTSQRSRNHETIHAMQWTELTLASGTILFFMVVLCGISAWWLLLSPLVYYIWYIVEWLVRLPSGNAYLNISFEREAYGNHNDSNYIENRRLFSGWMEMLY